MPVLLHRHRVAYWPVPKNACTTINHTLFELDAGRPYPDGRHKAGVHELHRAVPDDGRWLSMLTDYFTFVVVRDPVDRFVSAYRNRVRYHEDLRAPATAAALSRLGRSIVPEFDEFVTWFPIYFALSNSIRHHTRPQADFVRSVVDRVDRVYWQHELGALASDLSEHVGEQVAFGRRQTGGGDVVVTPTAAELRRIRSFVEPDVRMLRRFGLEADTSGPSTTDRLLLKVTSPRLVESPVTRRLRRRLASR